MDNLKEELEAIIKTVKSNKRMILNTQVIGRDSEEWCNRDDLWAISTEELEKIKSLPALFESYVKACKPELPAIFDQLNDFGVMMYKKAADEYEKALLRGK